MARGLDGTSLVDIDVGLFGGNHALGAMEETVNHGGVGLRAPDKEIDASLVEAAGVEYELLGIEGETVVAIAGSLHEVGVEHPVEDFRSGAAHIVAVEMKHRFSY